MAFLAQIFAWIISDIRHIIIIVLSVLLIGMGVYSIALRWQVLNAKTTNLQLQVDNEKLKINNTNLTAQLEQCQKASIALQDYVKGLLKIKADVKIVKDQVSKIGSKEDEIKINNSIADLFNTAQ